MSATVFSISLRRPLAAAVAAALGLGLVPQVAFAAPMHGIAMTGEPALPPDFDHLPYANPDAPQGGRITYGVVGSFDSLNPFIVQGGFTSSSVAPTRPSRFTATWPRRSRRRRTGAGLNSRSTRPPGSPTARR